MKIFNPILFFLMCCLTTFGQEQNTDRLLNQGQLPEDFTTSPNDKFLESLKNNNISPDEKKQDNNQKEFFLGSAYVIDQLLKSGYILYNDPVGNYVNEVLDVIVASNPELKQHNPRAYILRSTEVNAFAVDQGIIFVSLGLLSQLENEAQLALILSHELVHVKEKHGLDGFLEAIRVDKDLKKKRQLKSKQIDLASLEKNQYSREQEMEADEKGLTYFLNTNYSFANIQRVFDVLRYSYLPYDEIPFELSALEKISAKIPEENLLEEVEPINPAEEDEEQSTHPALSKRIEQFEQRLKGKKVTDEKDYLVSEELFRNMQFKSRAELARTYLERQKLAEAIYAAFLMNKIYGESDFTKEIIGEALYGMTKFKNNDLTSNISNARYFKIEGESQQVYYLLENFSDIEMNVLAIAYNFDRFQEQPQDSTLRSMIVDLFSDLNYFHKTTSLTSFYFIDDLAEDSTEVKEPDEKLSKIDKIKSNKKQKDEVSWYRLAFSDVLNDPLFREIAQEGFDAGKEYKEWIDHYDSSTRKGYKNRRLYNEKIKKNGYSLGIKKALLINPYFIHLKGKFKNLEVDFPKSEKRNKALKDIVLETAKLNNVDIQFLDAHDLGENDADKLNDIMVANEWMDTQIDAEDFIYQSYNKDEIDALADKYDTPYIITVSVISIRKASGLARIFNRKTKSLVFVGLLDTSSGERVILKSELSSTYLSDVYLKSEFYDAFYQLSK